jgi:DNA polymerase
MAGRSAALFIPAERTLPALEEAALGCTGCDLYLQATQTVFGSGPHDAAITLVGEQPGDREDLEGEPFVGPAGRLLDKALDDAGIVRERTYLTNAVKHFKWMPRGGRRVHVGPQASEVRACRPWLEAEIDIVRPRIIVALGATAVAALLGPKVKVMKNRGEIVESVYGPCLVTVHPSALLRIEEPEDRRAAYDLFVADMRRAVDYARRVEAVSRPA